MSAIVAMNSTVGVVPMQVEAPNGSLSNTNAQPVQDGAKPSPRAGGAGAENENSIENEKLSNLKYAISARTSSTDRWSTQELMCLADAVVRQKNAGAGSA